MYTSFIFDSRNRREHITLGPVVVVAVLHRCKVVSIELRNEKDRVSAGAVVVIAATLLSGCRLRN